MASLILIKHARPLVDPTRPPSQWKLSPDGEHRCAALAAAIKTHQPEVLLCSTEIKARQTARLLGESLGLTYASVAGLEEHHRDSVPHLATREFLSLMAIVLKQPRRIVIGEESAGDALARFTAAVEKAMGEHPGKNLAIVSHGTVIALFAAHHTGEDGYLLWRAMELPSYLIFDLTTKQITHRQMMV